MTSADSLYQVLKEIVTVNPYLASFLIGFFMSFGVFFSFFPATVLMVVLLRSWAHQFEFAVLFGAGAALGEMFSYVIGYFGKMTMDYVISRREKVIEFPERFREFINWFDKVLTEYGDEAVFLFALTPLPDDLLLIYMGARRYSFYRAFLACWLGKVGLALMYVVTVVTLEPVFVFMGDTLTMVSIIVATIGFFVISYIVSKKRSDYGLVKKTIVFLKRIKVLLIAAVLFLIKLLSGGEED